MTASAPVLLAGAGATAESLSAVAAASCFGCAAGPPYPSGARVALVGDGAALAREENWAAPVFAWIETLDADAAELAATARRAQEWDFFCSFGAVASADLPLAGRIAGLVSRRHPEIAHDLMFDIELALHEAVSNALVHGNLGVGSMQELSMNALDEYSRLMERGLADPRLTSRRVEVAGRFDDDGFSVEVADEGAGYDVANVKGQGACGRGLELIAAVAQTCMVLDGGRRLSMRFQL